MDIAKLLKELEDVVAFIPDHVNRQYMQSLCKQSAAAIRMLQAESKRGMADVHARFLLQLGDGLITLGKRMQSDV